MQKLRVVSYLLILALLAGLPMGVAAEDPAVTAAKTFARMEAWKAITSGAGSATVAIMDNGVTVYAEGFGMADREKGVPVDKDTLFNTGSIGKLYVATAIMLLVDDGLVDLDTPVADYLPEFTMQDARYKDITVRMLLNHASGLPGTLGPSSFGYRYNKDFYKDVLAILAGSQLKHRPGEFNPYCNDGFTLAEMVVAKISGMGYLDFLQKRIFKPLGLTHTGASVGMRTDKSLVAARFYNPAGKVLPPEVLSLLGAGGLSASAEDICRFIDSFAPGGRHILSEASLAEMNKLQPSEFSDKLKNPFFTNGLGWDFTELPDFKAKGIRLLAKGGDTTQYHSMTFILPEERIAVAVILTNNDNALQFAYKLLRVYIAEKGILDNTPPPIAMPPQTEPVPPELKAFEGYYALPNNLLRIAIDTNANAMTIYSVKGNRETATISTTYSDDSFRSDDASYHFAAIDGRRYLLLSHPIFHNNRILAEKIEPPAAPKALSIDIEGRRWLRRDVKAYEVSDPSFFSSSGSIPGLPGFVQFGGNIMKVTGPMTAAYPVANTRDLNELTLSKQDGVLWARRSGEILSDAAAAPALTGGKAALTIGNAGYSEWLKIDADAILSFGKPDEGRVLAFGPDGVSLYDSIEGNAEVFVPAGSFVAVAGEPGDVFSVEAR